MEVLFVEDKKFQKSLDLENAPQAGDSPKSQCPSLASREHTQIDDSRGIIILKFYLLIQDFLRFLFNATET